MSNVSTFADSGGGGPDDPRDAITRRNQLESPLLRLPAELRNEICKLVLGNTEISFLPWVPLPWGLFIHHYGRYYGTYVLSLTQVCRQLHQETQLLPFQLNNFVVRHERPRELLKVFEPKQSGAIRSMKVQISDFALPSLKEWALEVQPVQEKEPVLVTTTDSSLYDLVCPLLHSFPGLKHLILLDDTEKFRLMSLCNDVPKEGGVLVEVRPL
ncbi:hypothetical protein FB567DRAFT_526366 [Paraphoma chrysanthemicola]|uniref:Uncharacterized protein n=1 Tax=Paraphoma chrysanthemicola TaxID=798071 RepID=A0A8K0R7J3_9PLEO|nr:hypothetical protein FB567DRAFT_526366 [Paraphoma chrysanthemicola]